MGDARDLEHRAAVLTEAYRRHTWYRFVLVFFPVPFMVLLFRLQLEYWHYYLAGGAYMLFSLALFKYDNIASDKVDAAVKAADEARSAAKRGF